MPVLAQDAGAQLSPDLPAPDLQTSLELSREGHVVLAWQLPPAASGAHLLQQAVTEDFSAAQQWPIAAVGSLVQTGLADGRYYFRAGVPGQWSDVRVVQVSHHSLTLALGYFAVGLLLFCVLAGVIVHGNRTVGAAHD